MLVCLIFCLAALAQGQPTHPGGGHDFDIHGLSKGSFSLLDTSPTDGVLSESEWDALLDIYNSNGDNCTDFTEYVSHTGMPDFVARLVYGSLDTNSDGCLTSPEMATKFRAVDTNGNGNVDLAEYEAYYQDVFSHLTNPMVG